MRNFLLYVIIVSVFALSCQKNEDAPDFPPSDNLGLIVEGVPVLEYNPDTWQLSYIPSKHSFRASNDTMSQYYILALAGEPAEEGQKVLGSLTYSASSGVVRKPDLEFKVKRLDADGTLWLYASKKKVAVVVRLLK